MRINRRNKDVKNTLGRFHLPAAAVGLMRLLASAPSGTRFAVADVTN